MDVFRSKHTATLVLYFAYVKQCTIYKISVSYIAISRVHKREGKRVSHLLNAVFVVQRSSDGLLHIVT